MYFYIQILNYDGMVETNINKITYEDFYSVGNLKLMSFFTKQSLFYIKFNYDVVTYLTYIRNLREKFRTPFAL
ncbi:hypothetical protein BUY46_10925 [Staphylococcus devriesei]|nr:hypothetical protein BUY46_10925 [Staphylococcus devriesei]